MKQLHPRAHVHTVPGVRISIHWCGSISDLYEWLSSALQGLICLTLHEQWPQPPHNCSCPSHSAEWTCLDSNCWASEQESRSTSTYLHKITRTRLKIRYKTEALHSNCMYLWQNKQQSEFKLNLLLFLLSLKDANLLHWNCAGVVLLSLIDSGLTTLADNLSSHFYFECC